MDITSEKLIEFGIQKPFSYGLNTEAACTKVDKYFNLFINAVAEDVMQSGTTFVKNFPSDLTDPESFKDITLVPLCIKMVKYGDHIHIDMMSEVEKYDFGSCSADVNVSKDAVASFLQDLTAGEALVYETGAKFDEKSFKELYSILSTNTLEIQHDF